MKHILSEFLNDEIFEVELFKEWFLSQWYKVKGANGDYFVRSVKNNVAGFEYIWDDLRSFLISHQMYENAGLVKSHGTFEHNNQTFHAQEAKNGETIDIDSLDDNLVKLIAQKIATLHRSWKEKVNSLDKTYKKLLYRRWWRELLTNHETTFSIFEHHVVWKESHALFEGLIEKMLQEYFRLMRDDQTERMTTLHWDFWHGNILLDSETEDLHLIDFSRIPYWDPGIDVGLFLWQFSIRELVDPDFSTRKNQIKNIFLKEYCEITWDQEIEKFLTLSELYVWFIHLSPLLQQFLKWSDEQKEKVYQYLLAF